MTFNKLGQRVFSASFINSIIHPIDPTKELYMSPYAEEGKWLMCSLCNETLPIKYKYIINWTIAIREALKARGHSDATIEKHMVGAIWHGYIDIYTDECIYELKVRSHNKAELTTLIQCEIYKRLTNLPYIILHINRQTGKVVEAEINEDLRLKAVNIIEKFEELIRFMRDFGVTTILKK